MYALHEQIAADAYWTGPVAEDADRLPMNLRALDIAHSFVALRGLDMAYRAALTHGANIRPIPVGGPLSVDDDGSFIRIVEDARSKLRRNSFMRPLHSEHGFDTFAAHITDTDLYSGDAIATTVEGVDGSFTISRNAVYLRNAASHRRLVGKASGLIARGSLADGCVFRAPEVVGDVRRRGRGTDIVLSRIVAATVITPARSYRGKKIFDLSAVRRLGLTPQVLPNPI